LEEVPPGFEQLTRPDEGLVASFLRRLSSDYFNLLALRTFAYERALVPPVLPLATEDLIALVAGWIVDGDCRVALAPRPPPPQAAATEQPAQPRPPPPVAASATFSLQVVDDITEDPIAHVALVLKLPSGEQRATTDSSGRIDIGRLPRGLAAVSSDVSGARLARTLGLVKLGALPSRPRAPADDGRPAASGTVVARIIEHHVKRGDSLVSIAGAYGHTADEITEFNWGTTDPDATQEHLFADVGCTETDAHGKPVFTPRDRPGIIYVPRPLQLSGLRLDERHVLRVKNVPEPGPVHFGVSS
jgi:hypothetical protein